MKTSHCSLKCFGILSGSLLALPLLQAQVVIEGGPGVVQISDQDGRPEPVVPGGARAVVPAPPDPVPPVERFQDRSRVRSVEMQPVPDSPVTVLVPTEPVANEVRTSPVAAVPAVPEVDVDVARRKAELVRALGLNDSGTGAAAAFFSDGFFDENTAIVSSAAAESLALLAEFIRLSPHQRIAVNYEYAPSLHNEELAWQRSLGVVEWLKTRGGLAASNFVVLDPVIVTEPTPTTAEDDGDLAVLRNRVTVVVDYR